MALPTLTSRPEKTIDSSLSRWNAAALPIQYQISNTKWPTNTEDDIDTISSVADDNGYAQIVLSSTSEIYKVKEQVNILGTTSYNGPQTIRAISGLNITIDAPFVASETGTLQRYFPNYTSVIRVYAGLPPTHEYAYFKELELTGTIEQRPNTDNISYVDIRKYILSNLSTFNDIDQSSFPNDLNLWTGFYIEWAERYDQVLSGVVYNFESTYQTDLDNICFGSHSALQFRNDNGGNMAAHLLGGSVYKEDLTQFMTDFERPKLFLNQYFDLSIINAGGNFLYVKEYDINSIELNEQIILVENNDAGVYRMRIDELTFNTETDHITAQIAIPDFLPEDLMLTVIDDDIIDLAWTNEVNDRTIEIYRDSVLIDTVPAGTVSYSDSGLAPETEYCYTVKYAGAISSSNEECATTFFAFSFTTSNTPSVPDPFDPTITYGGADTPIWKFPNGTTVSGVALNITDGTTNGLDGTNKIVRLLVLDKTQITSMLFGGNDIEGAIDITGLTGINGAVSFSENNITSFTAATATYSSLNLNSNSLTTIVLTGVSFATNTVFNISSNTGLSSITWPVSPGGTISEFRVNSANLSSIPISDLVFSSNCIFRAQANASLTSLTGFNSGAAFSDFTASSCGLTTLNLTDADFTASANMDVNSNSSLSAITYPSTFTGSLAFLFIHTCNFSGTLALGSVTFAAGANLNANSNSGVTDVTFSGSPDFDSIVLNDCDITGVFDLSGITLSNNLNFVIDDNPNMTGITFPATVGTVNRITAPGCGLTSLDLTGFDMSGVYSTVSGILDFSNNAALVNVTLPALTNAVRDLWFDNDDINVASFSTLTNGGVDVNGADIRLQANTLTVSEVNRYLVEIDGIANSGTTGKLLDISGDNAAPDGSSGGNDGDAAVTSLVSKGFTVTTN